MSRSTSERAQDHKAACLMNHSCTARQCVCKEAAANEDYVASRCLIGFGREETRRFRRFDGTEYREGAAFY